MSSATVFPTSVTTSKQRCSNTLGRRVQNNEPGAEPRELPRSGFMETLMADTIKGDNSGAQSEMEKVAGHHARLLPQARPLS